MTDTKVNSSPPSSIPGDIPTNDENVSDNRVDLGTNRGVYSIDVLPPLITRDPFDITAFHSEVDTQLESLDAPDSLSPHHYEQNARELLIERERQSRLERERARLKRHLALSRDRQEEEEDYQEEEEQQDDLFNNHESWRSHHDTEFSDEDFLARRTRNHHHHDSEQGDNKSAVCTVGEASEILSTHPSNDGRTSMIHPYGYVMERFLSENLGAMERPQYPPMELMNEIDPLLQHSSGYIDSRFPSSFVSESRNYSDHSDEFQRLIEHNVRVHDDALNLHDGSSHFDVTRRADDDVNDTDIDQDDVGIPSESDSVSYNSHSRLTGHSDVDSDSIGNVSTHSTQGRTIPNLQSLSNFDLRPMPNIHSEGTQTTMQESISASSIQGRDSTDVHPTSLSSLDNNGNFQAISLEALGESNSIASITSVLANVSVHSDESNVPLSIPTSRRNTHDDMMIQMTVELATSEKSSQDPYEMDRSVHGLLDYESIADSDHSSIGIGKHPLSPNSSTEYDKISTMRALRISSGSSKMNESFESMYRVADEKDADTDEIFSSGKTLHKVPSTVISYPQRRMSKVFDSDFCSHDTRFFDEMVEDPMNFKKQQFIGMKVLAKGMRIFH